MEIKDRVLVVEDDKRISNFIKTVLEANNYDVIVAQTGAEAYSMVTSQCPDVGSYDGHADRKSDSHISLGIALFSVLRLETSVEHSRKNGLLDSGTVILNGEFHLVPVLRHDQPDLCHTVRVEHAIFQEIYDHLLDQDRGWNRQNQ